MNSESTKELLKWQNSALVIADMARGKTVCDFAFLTSSEEKFFMTVGLAIPPLTI